MHRAGPDSVAFLGPLPPARTGIATYDRAVLDGLRRIGFFEEVAIDAIWPVEHRDVAQISTYHMGVFQLGNNVEFHLAIYRMAWHTTPLIVLHDLALDDFVRGMQAKGDRLGFIAAREALELRDMLHTPDVLRNEPLRVPWCAAIARRARGIIVHADFGRRYLEELGCRTPIHVVPHPVVEDPGDVRRAEEIGRRLRRPLEARGARTVVVAPGDMNAAKRLDALLKAGAQLDPSIHIALVGRRIPGYDVGPLVEAARLGDRVTVQNDVTDDEFWGWLLAADIVVDLRFPHRGEVSGSLARAMQAGRPSIVSATGTYLDLPEGTTLTVAPGPTNPSELAARVRTLAEDGDLRARMGERARAHVERLRSTEATAHGYAEAIRSTLDIAKDPAHRVEARWARSLVEIGVTEELVREGYGASYVRALESFKRSE